MRLPLLATILSISTSFALAGNSTAHAQSGSQAKPKTDAELIANAMSAAPRSVSRDATILAMDGDKMRALRQGKGAFTCMPNDPSTPGNDPMCLDQPAMEWLHAWMDHKDPPKKMGLVYMLQGGSDASNDDPFATKPAPAKKWVTTGPHTMIVGMAGSWDAYPKTADAPDKPFVMWAGTAYEHIMMPVR